MKLKNLSESFIKEFAGTTIFGRGKEYCQNQMVGEINYDSVLDHIQAEVSGSSRGHYDVEITGVQRGIDAVCSCPYEGYPCKHIVAVMLTFIKKREELLKQSTENKKKMSSLKEKVQALSKDRLAEMLLLLAGKYPDCRRDLLIQMGDDPQEAMRVISKQIRQIFCVFESEEYSTSSVVKQLKGILNSVGQSRTEIKARVYWAIADRILKELNEYGMDDVPLEDMAMETLSLLPQVLSKGEIDKEEKARIVQSLEKYAAWANCDITDCVDEAIEKIKNQ